MAFKSLSSLSRFRRAEVFTRLWMLACLLLVIVAIPAQAKVLGTATLGAATDTLALSPYTLVQPDPQGKVTPEAIEASNGAILSGAVSPYDMVTLDYRGESTWLTIKIQNTTAQTGWVLDFGRRTDGRLGYLENARAYKMYFTPEQKIVVREIQPMTDHGTFKFDFAQNEQGFILINVKPAAGKPVVLPLTLYSERAYMERVSSVFTSFATHSAFLLLYAVFFAATALARNNKKLVLFAAFFTYEFIIWCITESIGASIGFGLLGIIIPCMMLGFTIFSIFMTKIFFDIELGSFTERSVLYGLVSLNIIATLLAFLLPINAGTVQVALLYGAPFITFSVLALMAGAQAANGNVAGRYYFVGSIFPVLGLIIVILGLFGALPHNPLLINALWYSVSFQGFFMAIAVHRKFALQTGAIAYTTTRDDIDFSRIQETKDRADHTRLLKVIEKERELLAEFRAKENQRVEEMRHAKEEADEANRAKSAFLAVVSHEIRTPMTGVMGMVRLLLDSNITKQQRDYVLTIQESSEAMMALLNDILDFERIQRGKIEMENISFDLHRLIQGVITLMSGHAAEKGIQLAARIDDDLPRYVKGDPTRLRQVLLNLMGNAIKFTTEGGVTLLVKDMSEDEQPAKEEKKKTTRPEKALIYFAVQDTGIGISAEARRNLFSPFAQADSTITRKFGGTGLGLAISKGLVERMGSMININSKEGEGSTFFFTLDLPRGTQPSAEKTVLTAAENANLQTAPLRILVVDDNEITRKVVIGFLQNTQHDITTANNAEEALAKIDQDAFDLIFMDIEMTGMAGNEATKILREHRDRVKAAIPVIAMTGNVAKEDKERYLADGMSGFIGKPIDADQLLSIVDEIAHKTFEREIRMPETPKHIAKNEPKTDQPAAAAQDKAIFNPDMLQSLKDTIGAQQLGDLLGDLITKTDEILQAMDAATKANDLTALAARAHELKGMAGNFGLVEISDIAAQAERKAKTSDTSDLDTLIGTLPAASQRAQTLLKEWSAS